MKMDGKKDNNKLMFWKVNAKKRIKDRTLLTVLVLDKNNRLKKSSIRERMIAKIKLKYMKKWYIIINLKL